MTEIDAPVLIAGGGPVGMTLALNLARYGIRSMLVERNFHTTRHPKMDLTNGRSMELFHRLGIVNELRDAGVPSKNPFEVLWCVNPASQELHRFRYPSPDEIAILNRSKNDGSFTRAAPLRVSQIQLEPVLKRFIDAHPLIDVRFGVRFDAIVENGPEWVVAQIVDEGTGKAEQIRCQYLAGCDGGGSRVRRELGIELDGEMEAAAAYMVHFRSDDKTLFQRHGPTWHYQNGTGTIIAQNDDDIYTLQAWLLPGSDLRERPPAEILENWVGTAFNYEILQSNPWSAHFVVAKQFRKGRVILAGDAAHQLFPTGGYGMNSGIADAAGLSWMLAANVRGWGTDALFDAYHIERWTTDWMHVRASQRHMGVRQEIAEAYEAAGNLSGESAQAAENREKLSADIVKIGNAENESWGVEHGYVYDSSPIIWHDGSSAAFDPLIYEPNTTPGARLPHIFLDDEVSVHDKLGLFFTLLMICGPEEEEAFSAAAKRLSIPLEIVKLHRPDLISVFERSFLLVRPDQHVAWRGDVLPADPERLLRHVAGLTL